ncbi:TetR/AcrR family transcriptional regulator [Lentzea sp. NPDC051213]|uniref:TetR/AcrR family transcriptional regulator n=1 Tax=Lentzea sp. NPDC051213 TaxID=3364126 RepID=UPI003799D1A5
MTRAAQAERTRAAILTTARTLFATHGYDATSLQTIADEMDVTKANVYYYFRTKSAILEALLDNTIVFFEALLRETAKIRGKRARAEHMVAGFVDQVVANRALSPLGRTDPSVRRNERINAELARLAAEAMRLLYGDDPTDDQRAAWYLASDVGPVIAGLRHLTDDELREVLKRLCLRVLRG